MTNLKTGALLTRTSGSVVLSHLLTDSGQDQEWLLDYNGKTEGRVKSFSSPLVEDVLETEESCYQSLPSHPAPGLTYQAAAEVCQNELNGTLVREESLNTTDLSLLLSGVLPYSSPGTEHGWWLAGDDEDVCRQVSVSGVTEESCEGGGLALCQLGLHCPQYSQDLVGPAHCVCGCRDWTAQPSAGECELCWEGEFCYQDYYYQSEYCVQVLCTVYSVLY